jgi:hypothetical protein
MEIRIATESDKNLWDEIIANSRDSTIFHTWKWLLLMEKYSYKKFLTNSIRSHLYPMIISEHREVIGVIPLYSYKNYWGIWIQSPPLHVECLYLGPIFNHLETLKPRERYHKFLDFQIVLHKYLTENLRANSIKIRSSTGFEDPRGFQWNEYTIEPRFTYFLNLTQGKESIWRNFRKTLRNSITRNEQLGIEVIEGSRDDLEPIFHLMKERNRIETPLGFLHEIFDTFYPHHVRIFIAKHHDRLLSGILITIFKNKVSFWVGSPRTSFEGVSPNDFILWHIIQWSIDQGMEIFEIMGADDLSLFPFKTKFNAELDFGYWAKWISPRFRRINSFHDLIRLKEIT